MRGGSGCVKKDVAKGCELWAGGGVGRRGRPGAERQGPGAGEGGWAGKGGPGQQRPAARWGRCWPAGPPGRRQSCRGGQGRMWQGRVNFKYGRQLGRGKEEAWARERGRGGEPGGGSRGRTCRQAWCSRADAGAGAGAALQVGAVAVAGSQEERTGWVASPGESIAAGEGEEKGGQGRVDGGGRGEEGEEGGGRTTARTPRRSTAQHSAAQRSAAQRLLVVVVALAAGSVLCAPLAAQRDHSGVKVDVGQAAHHQAGGGVRVSLADCGAPGGGGGYVSPGMRGRASHGAAAVAAARAGAAAAAAGGRNATQCEAAARRRHHRPPPSPASAARHVVGSLSCWEEMGAE